MFCPSGEGARIGNSAGECASAFGRAEEAALQFGRGPSRPDFWGERWNHLTAPSCNYVTKTHQTCTPEETCVGPEAQHPTQGEDYDNKSVLNMWKHLNTSSFFLFSSVCCSLSKCRSRRWGCFTTGWLDWPEKEYLFVNIWFLLSCMLTIPVSLCFSMFFLPLDVLSFSFFAKMDQKPDFWPMMPANDMLSFPPF